MPRDINHPCPQLHYSLRFRLGFSLDSNSRLMTAALPLEGSFWAAFTEQRNSGSISKKCDPLLKEVPSHSVPHLLVLVIPWVGEPLKRDWVIVHAALVKSSL